MAQFSNAIAPAPSAGSIYNRSLGRLAPTPTTVCEAPTIPPLRLRLASLDGIRGLAALYVVVFHLGTILKPVMTNLSKPWRLLLRATEHGHAAVVAFIVLSGFLLMLPIVRENRPMSLQGYFLRRSRRILPPYFAALILFLLWGIFWRRYNAVTGHSTLAPPAYPFVVTPTLAGIL
jgi:peptidoglycan/LPS O-acetylase OafA/YrhL